MSNGLPYGQSRPCSGKLQDVLFEMVASDQDHAHKYITSSIIGNYIPVPGIPSGNTLEVACASWIAKEKLVAGALLTELVAPLNGGKGQWLARELSAGTTVSLSYPPPLPK